MLREAFNPKRVCARRTEDGRIPSAQALSSSVSDTTADNSSQNKDFERKRQLLLTLPSKPGSSPSKTVYMEDEEDRGGLQHYHCDACQRDITNVFHIRCGDCLDFDLCVPCFVKGVETGTHRNDHSYIPIGRNDFPVFTPNWSADEEIMLLEGVSKFGFGNWSEIAELVVPYSLPPKRKEQCEEHYYSVHIKPYYQTDPSAELPEEKNARELEYQKRMIGQYHLSVPQLTKPPSNSTCNIVGFMPLRGDFDIEYDNDAELILSDIEFRGDETPIDRELKLKVLDVYNARMNERILRKKVVIEKGFVDWRRTQQLGRRRMKEEVDIHNLFKLLARFDLDQDYEELASLFLAERKLRRRVEVLNEWRSLGLKTFKEVEEYEKLKSSKFSGGPVTSEQVNKVVKKEADSQSSPKTQEKPSNELFMSQQLEASASQYPGAKILTEKELEFCDSLQIPPVYFILTKYSLLNALIQHKNPNVSSQLNSLRLDASRQGNLYDFIIHTKLNIPEQSCTPVEELKTVQKKNSNASGSVNTSLNGQAAVKKTRLRRRI